MVSVDESDVADAMHLDSVEDLPSGYTNDIEAAVALVESQVEPYADADDQSLVDQCAVYVAAAFVGGTEGDAVVRQMQRESQSVTFDTETASDEAMDFWHRAQAFDPTGRLGTDTQGVSFETF